MFIARKPMQNRQNQLSGQHAPVNGEASTNFSSLPSLMDEFFFNDPFFKWGTDWLNDYQAGRSLGTALPAVNIRETDNEFVLEVAAPGLNKKDFKVECSGNQLSISYRHSEENTQGGQNTDHWRREYNFESFERSFLLPETADPEKVEAKYEDGILKVMVAKREEARKKPAREIAIN